MTKHPTHTAKEYLAGVPHAPGQVDNCLLPDTLIPGTTLDSEKTPGSVGAVKAPFPVIKFSSFPRIAKRSHKDASA